MIPIKCISLSVDSTIRTALEIIDSAASQIAFVVDKNNVLKGAVTDGDIRRGLLKGLSIEDSVNDVYNPKPISCPVNTNDNEIKRVAREHSIKQIPMVDEQGVLIEVKIISDLLQEVSFDNKVIIMAGGLGSRLGELTKETPKPLLKVAQKPILHTIIDNFVKHGFSNFILSVNYKSNQIKQYFKNGEDIGVNIEYLDEEKRMGTAGSLSLLTSIPNKPFFVMNGDILTSIDFKQMLDFHNQNSAYATMGVREYENQIPFGVVNTEGNCITSIEEKPIQNVAVSSGVYILNPECIEHIPKNLFFDMPTLFQEIIAKQKDVKAYPITDYWIDIGHINEYEKANKDYSRIFDAK